MIDLRIQPSALWFGLDFVRKKLERALRISEPDFYNYLQLCDEVQFALVKLLNLPSSYKVRFFSHEEMAYFLHQNTLNHQNSLGKNYIKEPIDQELNVCMDVSYEIPFDLPIQLEKIRALSFDPSKGLGLLPGMMVVICHENTETTLFQKFDPEKYMLLKQFHYILDQLSLRGLDQLKQEFLTKAALIDHMVVNQSSLSGYLIKDNHLRSPYVQAIRVNKPQKLFEYLRSHGFIIETGNQEWMLPNFIVHSKETFYYLDEVLGKYE